MIPITYFRSSCFNTHKACEMQYFIEYVLGWRAEANAAAVKGTCVHSVLELFALAKKNKQEGKDEYIDGQFGQVTLNSDVCALSKKVCDYFFRQSNHDYTDKDYKDVEEWVNIALNSSFDPRKLNIEATELPFDIEIKEDWAKYEYRVRDKILSGNLRLKGTIDLVVKNNKDIEVCDWKTGSKLIDWWTGEELTYEKLSKSIQVNMYLYAIHKLYPNIQNIIFTLFYLRCASPFTFVFERNQVYETLNRLKEKFEYIKNTKTPTINRSWRCKKFCHFGKNFFSEPLIQREYGQLSKIGDRMCMCDQIDYMCRFRPIEQIIENMSREGYNISSYDRSGDI